MSKQIDQQRLVSITSLSQRSVSVLYSSCSSSDGIATSEWCSRIDTESPSALRMSAAFWSSIELYGMIQKMRCIPFFAACFRAWRRLEYVFPPPVGTESVNIPRSASAAAQQISDISARTAFIAPTPQRFLQRKRSNVSSARAQSGAFFSWNGSAL